MKEEIYIRKYDAWHKVLLALIVLILPFIDSQAQGVNAYLPDQIGLERMEGIELVWNEEFNYSGKPDSSIWQYEEGFRRNNELQWYQEENASVGNGVLTLEAKRTYLPNPQFAENSNDWRKNRKIINFTSSSINTRNSHQWTFGTFIIRAKIDTTLGAWPAIWTLGIDREWPSNGEIDIMEFYRSQDGSPIILANTAWGTGTQWKAKWDDAKIELSHFTKNNDDWVNQFHIWKMEWTEDFIRIYLDDELLNETDLTETFNPDGYNPFHQPHYLLLNLAVGGTNGGTPLPNTQEIKYEVDYVRIYQSVEK